MKLTTKEQSYPHYGMKSYHIEVDLTDKYRPLQRHIWTDVDGDIHTNSVESFWALLKRGITGQYHKVSIHHLPKYIDEFYYRQNNRKESDVFNKTVARALEVRI